MASNPDFVQYIADQCAGAGKITVKKMFGDYGIYCDGVIFGLVCDNRFYLKPTEVGRSLLRSIEMRPCRAVPEVVLWIFKVYQFYATCLVYFCVELSTKVVVVGDAS